MKSYHSNRVETRRPSRLKRHQQSLHFIYKGLRPHYIPLPSAVDWVIYFAMVGSNLDFMVSVLKLIGTAPLRSGGARAVKFLGIH